MARRRSLLLIAAAAISLSACGGKPRLTQIADINLHQAVHKTATDVTGSCKDGYHVDVKVVDEGARFTCVLDD
jgi:hypothetical protein